MKLWIDDIRTPPDGWEWAKTSKEAIDVIDNNEVSHISFDHDLGGGRHDPQGGYGYLPQRLQLSPAPVGSLR